MDFGLLSTVEQGQRGAVILDGRGLHGHAEVRHQCLRVLPWAKAVGELGQSLRVHELRAALKDRPRSTLLLEHEGLQNSLTTTLPSNSPHATRDAQGQVLFSDAASFYCVSTLTGQCPGPRPDIACAKTCVHKKSRTELAPGLKMSRWISLAGLVGKESMRASMYASSLAARMSIRMARQRCLITCSW